jgi:hypothetical protein
MIETANAPYQVRLNYDGTFLGIRSDDSATLAWLIGPSVRRAGK